MITIIVAFSKNFVIGKDGKIPWNLKKDLERFRKLTIGNTVVMGRKTFESIGKPLENRKNIVLTRNKDFKRDGIIVVNIFEELENILDKNENIFIIGGAEIYEYFLPKADKLELTYLDEMIPGDAFFPKFYRTDWILEEEVFHKKDENNEFGFWFRSFGKF